MQQDFLLILASSSPRRLSLLKNIALNPDQVIAPDLDETAFHNEKPAKLVTRLAEAKATKVANSCPGNAFILGADTNVSTKARIFEKADNNEIIKKYLQFFSGRRIYIHTAISVVKVENSVITATATKLVTSNVKFRRLSSAQIEHYLNTGNGIGTAGGFSIQGFGETLIQNVNGSYSGIIGLPLGETINLLAGLGYETFKSQS